VWECANIPDEASVEYDEDLDVEAVPRSGGGYNYYLTVTEAMEYYMVARLWEDGPILDNALIRGIEFENSAQDAMEEILETYEDGSCMVEIVIRLSYVPSDLTIDLNIFVGGVTFDDGTTFRTVTAADFNELGEYRYRMIKASDALYSVCHTTSIYQDGTYIGDNH